MAPGTAKQMVKDLFRGKGLTSIPFIPLISTVAAKVAQVSVRELLTNPTRLANTLQTTQRLLNTDAVVCLYDPSLEAEACGCELDWSAEDRLPEVVTHPLARGGSLDLDAVLQRGRVPLALEVFHRLEVVVGRTVGMVAVVTGPVTLGSRLRGPDFRRELNEEPAAAKGTLEAAGRVVIALAQRYCDLKADAVIVADPDLAALGPRALAAVADVYRSIANVVRYFEAGLVIWPGEAPLTDELLQLESDAMLLGGTDISDMRQRLAMAGRGLGTALGAELFTLAKDQARAACTDLLRQVSRRGFFVSTAGEVPFQAPVETVLELARTVKSIRMT